MTTENEAGLAAAIEKIQESALGAGGPALLALPYVDGKGGKLEVSVLATRDGEGHPRVVGTTEFVRSAAALAEDLRLKHAAGPDNRSGTALHQSLGSLVEHANRFKAENSAIWANPQERKLVAVLDYHPAGADSPARWGRHRGVYECPLSEAWKAWGGITGLTLDQDELSALLDSRDRELASGKLPNLKAAPDPSFLVTLAHSLEVYSEMKAKRFRDPATGRMSVSFTEEKGIAGEVTTPPAFLIRIPIFEDSTTSEIEVRLRVSVEDGKASFAVQIHAAQEVLRRAFDGLCDQVAALTELPVFRGKPE